jgi:hypothetical protein
MPRFGRAVARKRTIFVASAVGGLVAAGAAAFIITASTASAASSSTSRVVEERTTTLTANSRATFTHTIQDEWSYTRLEEPSVGLVMLGYAPVAGTCTLTNPVPTQDVQLPCNFARGYQNWSILPSSTDCEFSTYLARLTT